jgi:hypothetical protein
MCRLRFPCLLVATVLLASPASALVANSADDLCPPSVDPCVVTQPIDVEAGSHLDFGLRTFRIEGAGLLDFADGRGAIWCGRLETATAGPSIRARAESSPAVVLEVVSRKRCSGALQPCLVDADCEGRGACSLGDGSIDLRGGLSGNAEAPGQAVLRSAGDLAVRAPVALAGTRSDSDGGSLTLESTQGSVLLEAAIDVSGGGGGCGGDVSVTALENVAVLAPLDATGGEYDGGSVSLEAGRNVTIAGDIAVDAKSGAGAGGDIDVLAAGDIVVGGAADSSVVVLSADGHQSAEYEGGDGGAVSFEADGSIRITSDVRLAASAAAPDGFGDSLSFSAELDVEFDGTVIAKGRGTGGAGALVDLYAGRDARIGAGSVFELTGSAVGGDLMVETGRAFSTLGAVDVSGGAAGLGGRVVTVSGGDSRIGGTWTTAGAQSEFTVGEVFAEGCRVRVDGMVANGATAGRNRFVAHDALLVSEYASIVASGQGGSNSFTHRGVAGEPPIDGTVAPEPAVIVDAALSACPACSDAIVEPNVHVATLRMRSKDAPGEDALVWKSYFDAGMLPDDPASASLRVIVSDALEQPLVDFTLPAGALVRGRASWRFARSEADPSVVRRLAIDVSGRDGLARMRARLDGLDLPEATTPDSLRLALRFGDESQSSACSSDQGWYLGRKPPWSLFPTGFESSR